MMWEFDFNGKYHYRPNWMTLQFCYQLTLGHTRKFISPPCTRGGGRGVWTPPLSFWYVAVFRNDFAFSGKPLILSKSWGIFYGWWRCLRSVTSPNMVATFHLGFYQQLEIRYLNEYSQLSQPSPPNHLTLTSLITLLIWNLQFGPYHKTGLIANHFKLSWINCLEMKNHCIACGTSCT